MHFIFCHFCHHKCNEGWSLFFFKFQPYPASFSTKHIKGKVTKFGMEPIFEWKWYAFTVYASCFICVFLKFMFFSNTIIWKEKFVNTKNYWKLVFLNQKTSIHRIQHTCLPNNWIMRLADFYWNFVVKNSKYRDFTFDWFSFWHLKWLSHRVSKCKLTITWTWQGSGEDIYAPNLGTRCQAQK